MNRDPEHAYLKVIEADQDASLENGIDDDEGDIFTSGTFGADDPNSRWTWTIGSLDSHH